MILIIENDGPEIQGTNFWETEQATAGAFYLSVNAGAFRLLVPDRHSRVIAEFRTAKEIIISRGPWPRSGGQEAMELLFDDGSDAPFSLVNLGDSGPIAAISGEAR